MKHIHHVETILNHVKRLRQNQGQMVNNALELGVVRHKDVLLCERGESGGRDRSTIRGHLWWLTKVHFSVGRKSPTDPRCRPSCFCCLFCVVWLILFQFCCVLFSSAFQNALAGETSDAFQNGKLEKWRCSSLENEVIPWMADQTCCESSETC